jgi:limonene-1,2-epoxide hydrolase
MFLPRTVFTTAIRLLELAAHAGRCAADVPGFNGDVQSLELTASLDPTLENGHYVRSVDRLGTRRRGHLAASDEAAVRTFLEELIDEQWDADQIERALDRMSPDVRYHIYAWEHPLVGRDAIRAEWLRQVGMFSDFRSEIVTIGPVGQTVFVERAESMTLTGQPVTLHLVGVFEVDGVGRITEWRDYSDSREVAVKVGVDLAAQDRAM